MNLDELLKYAVWIIFFGIALVGVYFLLRRIGIV
jgi:hypothetical protein